MDVTAEPHDQYWNTKSSGAALGTGTRIQQLADPDLLQSQGTLSHFHHGRPARPVGTDAVLEANPIGASGFIEITHDQRSVTPGTLIHHQVKLRVECLPHQDIPNCSWSIHRDNRQDTQRVPESEPHDTLLDRSDIRHHWEEPVRHSDSNLLSTPTKAEMVAVLKYAPGKLQDWIG
ncbi:hypothetical protein LDENG_00127890 [Lucifuga dentata]|nr:hypothetical protein LDENG_00127890 [Lucifuga dentata]